MNDAVLSVRGLKMYFPAGGTRRAPLYVRAVSGVDLSVREGETLGLVGESGSGKSTIAYTVMGMYRPTAGRITFRGEDITCPAHERPLAVKKNLQIVFQDPVSSLNPHQHIRQILELPLKVHKTASREEMMNAVLELLRMVELPATYLYRSPVSIGGGERQMVSIARALASNPEFIILDEPTSALDVSIQAKIINMLLKLQKDRRLTYLFITHDLSLMRNIATRVAIMYLGKICEMAPTGDFFERPLHPYTRMLLSSIPVISPEEEAMKPAKVVSTGEIPSPVNIPPGCSFHSRCPEKEDLCSRVDPEMAEISPGHFVRCHHWPARGTGRPAEKGAG